MVRYYDHPVIHHSPTVLCTHINSEYQMIQMQYLNPPVKHYTALSFTSSEVNILTPRPER